MTSLAAPGEGSERREVCTRCGLAEKAVSQGQWRQRPPPLVGSAALQERDQDGALRVRGGRPGDGQPRDAQAVYGAGAARGSR